MITLLAEVSDMIEAYANHVESRSKDTSRKRIKICDAIVDGANSLAALADTAVQSPHLHTTRGGMFQSRLLTTRAGMFRFRSSK